jgi:hypothetical protein
VGHDFGVGFGYKTVIRFLEPLFELDVVFDDAVVNDDDAASAVAMRVGVLFGGTPVRGPACVADAVRAVDRTESNRLFEVAQFAFGAANLEIVAFIAAARPVYCLRNQQFHT